MNKNLITLAVVPLFALTGCYQDKTAEDVATTSDPSQNFATVASETVTQTPQGELVNTELLKAYSDAVQNGYQGSIEEFVALAKMYQENPQQATQTAANSGFSGSEMLLGAVAGAAVGALLASSTSSRSQMASSSYSSQRVNDRVNYAETEKDRRQVGGGGAVNNTTAAMAANQSRASSLAANNPSATARRAATTMPSATRNVATNPTMSRATTTAVRSSSVARGGFGGAVSSGG